MKLSELQKKLGAVRFERRHSASDHFGLSPILVFTRGGKDVFQVYERHLSDPDGKRFEDDLS